MTQAQLDVIIRVVEQAGLNEVTLNSLRRNLPGVRLTHCQAEDMEESEPYERRPGYWVFLLASDGHCLSLTRDLEGAVGLVLAET